MGPAGGWARGGLETDGRMRKKRCCDDMGSHQMNVGFGFESLVTQTLHSKEDDS